MSQALMDLKHFFAGKLAREEVASAFLATLLEARADFRTFFFGQMGCEDASALARADWVVRVEAESVDVRMDSTREGWVVLVENKISPGSMEPGQLLRYYRDQIARDPRSRVWMVYLTPHVGIGQKEVDDLRTDSCFQTQRDWVGQLGWDCLQGYLDHVAHEMGDGATFVTSGFREIQAAIARATEVIFVLAGGRERIAAMAKRALELLAERPGTAGIAFHSWRSRTEHTLYTAGGNMTVYLKAQFDAEEEKPYHPRDVLVNGGLRLGLATEFGISGRGRKDPRVRAYWREITGRGVIDIPGLGEHTLTPQGWYQYRTQVAGSIEEVAAQLADAGSAIVVALQPYFS